MKKCAHITHRNEFIIIKLDAMATQITRKCTPIKTGWNAYNFIKVKPIPERERTLECFSVTVCGFHCDAPYLLGDFYFIFCSYLSHPLR